MILLTKLVLGQLVVLQLPRVENCPALFSMGYRASDLFRGTYSLLGGVSLAFSRAAIANQSRATISQARRDSSLSASRALRAEQFSASSRNKAARDMALSQSEIRGEASIPARMSFEPGRMEATKHRDAFFAILSRQRLRRRLILYSIGVRTLDRRPFGL